MAPNETVSRVAVVHAISTMSHRIKNILQGINGGAHLIETGLDKKNLNSVAKGWEIVSRNQTQVSQLVMNLMVLSKPFEASRESCDLREVVNRAVKAQSATLEKEQVGISTELGDSKCSINVDSQAVQLMLENLLSVVCRSVQSFTQRFSRITVSQSSGEVLIKLEFGGDAFRNEPIEIEPFPTDRTDRQLGEIELEVAKTIATGHNGKLVLSMDSLMTKRILVSIPKS